MTVPPEDSNATRPPVLECGEAAPDGKVLKSRLWRLAEEKCIPLTASLEITLRCNLRCAHCYNFDRSAPAPSSAEELTPDEIRDIIDQLAAAGCLYLAFTGGEALLHPHLDDFIRHARKHRLFVRVKTNGALLTRDRAELLVEAGAASLDVSLYGASAATYEKFTGSAVSFDKTLEGIRNAVDAGLQVKVNVCLLRDNASEVEEMLALIESLGLGYGVNPFITERYDGTAGSLDHAVDRETLEELYRGPLRHVIRKPDFSPERSVQCGCARVNCGISASGEVYPCIGAPIPSGNVRKQRFRDIWRTSPEFQRIRGLTLEDFKTCRSCPDRPFCGRNSGVVYTNTGEYTGPEAFTCMEASVARGLHASPARQTENQEMD